MCRKSRSETFDRTKVGVYHAFNRTVRRSFLHGVDPLTGIDYSYRRTRFLERMQEITPFLCVEVLSFAIMENHWHCVLRNRPDKVRALSDREVAIRWLSVTSRKRCQHKQGGKIRESEIKQIVNDPERVAELRSRLSDISWFVRLLCQTIARECNIEDECTGRFFEERFKLNRLEDEADVLACMAYVDLNPLRAGLTDTLDGYAEVSIGERMRTLAEELPDTSQWLAPVEHPQETACVSTEHATGEVSDASNASDASETKRAAETPPNLGCVSMTLAAYTSLLWHLALESRPELQGRVDLSREQLQKPVSKDGTAVNLAELEERHRQY
uniref:transposase n=1 Tax=Roseimaritima sediminicola TaxID=2662066 RepID=UPI001F264E65